MKYPKPTESELRFTALALRICKEFKQTFKSNYKFNCFDGNFIFPDFKFEPSRLIIEIDGSIHWNIATDRDCKRDFWMEDRGYCVIHIPNNDVSISLEELIKRIKVIYPTFPKPSTEMFNRHKDYRIYSCKMNKSDV